MIYRWLFIHMTWMAKWFRLSLGPTSRSRAPVRPRCTEPSSYEAMMAHLMGAAEEIGLHSQENVQQAPAKTPHHSHPIGKLRPRPENGVNKLWLFLPVAAGRLVLTKPP